MLELRILSGLNRGAAMTIEDARAMNIGSADNSDVLILDHNIDAHHISLEYQEGELVLTPVGEVRAEDGSYITEPIIVERLHAFFLRGTWIGIADSEDDWSIFAIGGLLMLASWATASVFLPKESVLNDKKAKAGIMAEGKQESSAEIKKVTQPKKYYSREDLAEILNIKLTELQLRHLVDFKYDTEGWSIDANLDDEDRLRLERAVENFNGIYKPRFPINVRIVSLNSFLPFKVTQIMSGKMAGVTTDDGQRFFVGDTIDGYRLVSVQGNKAVFDGKRKIEIVL